MAETVTTLIEGRIGSDSGSNRGNGWDKFTLKGLELVTEERITDRRSHYTVGAVEAPAGKVFTVWLAADGGTPSYHICIVDPEIEPIEIKGYAGCFLKGRFRILAQADGNTFAPRLLKWWLAANDAQATLSKAEKEAGRPSVYTWAWQRRYAAHLATQITRRGVAEPAPMPEEA